MKVQTRVIGQITVAELVGEIDTVDTEGFSGAMEEIIAAHPEALVLDFSQVNYIASMGLSMLLHVARDLRARKCQMVIAGVKPVVRTVLDVVQMGSIIPIETTVAQAVERLEKRLAAHA